MRVLLQRNDALKTFTYHVLKINTSRPHRQGRLITSLNYTILRNDVLRVFLNSFFRFFFLLFFGLF